MNEGGWGCGGVEEVCTQLVVLAKWGVEDAEAAVAQRSLSCTSEDIYITDSCR